VIALFVHGREQGRFRGSSEGARGSSKGARGSVEGARESSKGAEGSSKGARVLAPRTRRGAAQSWLPGTRL